MKRPVERLKRKVEKENLWLFVLKLLTKGEKYGKEMRKEIEEKFGFWIGNVIAYKVLYLLERGGFITSEKIGKKRIYRITPKGKNELALAVSYLRSLASKLTRNSKAL